MEKVGGRIRRLREEQKMSISELADKLGMSQSHLSRIELGQYAKLSADQIVAIADALGSSMDYLIYGGVKVSLMDFVHLLPTEEAEYVKSHSDSAWLVLVREMKAEELSPEGVAQLIKAVRYLKEKKGD